MISVVIPLYNKENTIRRSIASVLNQTVDDYEIIVVDDGSTDCYIDQIPDDSRITIIHQENRGVSAARNKGISKAKGEFVAFLDADDEWKPSFLEMMMHLVDIFPECGVFASSYEQGDEMGAVTPIRLNGLPFMGQEGVLSNYFDVATKSDPPICSISIMVRSNDIRAIGGFPEGIRQGEDLLTWARLAVRCKIAYCTESLAVFHNNSHHSTERPKRIPPCEDVVGQELLLLQQQHPSNESLRSYIGHWHKMRASIFLRLPHQRENCIKEIRLAWNYVSKGKLILYWFLSLLPYSIRINFISKVNK